MEIPSFIFGGGAPARTPQEAARNRAVYEAIVSRMSSAPRDVGEGLSAVGNALVARSAMDRATKGEEAGQARVAELLGGLQDGADMSELIGVMSDPWAAENRGVSAISQALLQREFQKSDPMYQMNLEKGQLELDALRNPQPDYPTSVQEYLFSQDNPDFLDSPFAQKGGVTVNTGDGSSAFRKKFDELQATRYNDIQTEGEAAQRALNSFSAMEKALDDPAFYSGAGGETVLGLKRLGAAMGINPEGITSMESFNALSKQAALDIMGGSLGTGFSNADRDFVIEQVANLGNTPQGNKAIIGIQRKIAERKGEIAALATKYVQDKGQLDEGFDTVVREYAETNPLFDEQTGEPPSPGPVPGAVEDGYRFKGGDPSDPNNWEKV